MSEFNNVTITREANVYFDGAVTSRKVTFADGSIRVWSWDCATSGCRK